jgi:hypothetical protein
VIGTFGMGFQMTFPLLATVRFFPAAEFQLCALGLGV